MDVAVRATHRPFRILPVRFAFSPGPGREVDDPGQCLYSATCRGCRPEAVTEEPLSKIDRRDFVRRAGRWAGAATLAPSLSGLAAWAGPAAASPRRTARGPAGYGPLRPAGPELALPEGFSYAVLGVEGRPMSDGRPTPRAHDGMGLFPVSDDVVRLVRNHEDQDPPGVAVPLVSPELAYDPLAGGGTTALEVPNEADGSPVLLPD
ncbi:MAG: DUF839 domain-containing protein, partial [Gemmatimonadales bacterium]|nr:DUF839 domain-containing protein [Gemmatimonadales bacterium]